MNLSAETDFFLLYFSVYGLLERELSSNTCSF